MVGTDEPSCQSFRRDKRPGDSLLQKLLEGLREVEVRGAQSPLSVSWRGTLTQTFQVFLLWYVRQRPEQLQWLSLP